MLLVDAGGFAETDGPLAREKNAFILGALGTMGYDAVTFGPRELDGDVHDVGTVRAGPTGADPDETRVPIVMTNAAPAVDLETERFVVRDVGGVRVGVVGVSASGDGEAAGGARGDAAVATGEAAVATGEAVAELVARDVDVIVLLSQLTAAETDTLLTRVPGIDVVIAGRGAARRDRGPRVERSPPGGAIVVDPLGQGRAVDVIDLVVGGRGDAPPGGVRAFAVERVLLNPHIPLDLELQPRVIRMNARILAAGEAARRGEAAP